VEYEAIITNFKEEIKGMKIGTCDISTLQDNGMIFRNFPVFKNEKGKWISYPNIKRLDKWVPAFEIPWLKKQFPSLLKQLEEQYSI